MNLLNVRAINRSETTDFSWFDIEVILLRPSLGAVHTSNFIIINDDMDPFVHKVMSSPISDHGLSQSQRHLLVDKVKDLIQNHDLELFNNFWSEEFFKNILVSFNLKEMITFESASKILTEYFFIYPVIES